jgi:hypothetical protein
MRLAAIGITFVAASSAACAIVTGSTDGYQFVDAGSDGPACEGSACLVPTLQCVSSADCPGEAGTQACCLSVVSMSVAGTTCVAAKTCAQAPNVQLCGTSAECNGADCVVQYCPFGGRTSTIAACGQLLFCTAP